MTTKETIRGYFESLAQKASWETYLADDVAFTIHVGQAKQVEGKGAFLESTKGFYSMIVNVAVHDLLSDGERACALTHYALQPPNGGPVFGSDVAEVFSVVNGRIKSFDIYFDPTPYPR